MFEQTFVEGKGSSNTPEELKEFYGISQHMRTAPARFEPKHDLTHLPSVSGFINNQLESIRRMHESCGGIWTAVYLLILVVCAYFVLAAVKSFWLQVLAMLLSAIFASALTGGQFKRRLVLT